MKRHPEVEEHITQIIPAAGYEAVFKNTDTGEEFSHPILAWGIVVRTETLLSGEILRYTHVQGLTLCADENSLDAANDANNFVTTRSIASV